MKLVFYIFGAAYSTRWLSFVKPMLKYLSGWCYLSTFVALIHLIMNNDTFDLVHRSVMDYSMTDDERKLEGLRITCDKVLPPIDFLFRIWDKPCFPRGELVAVTGKAKSGKTLFNSMLMGGSLSPDPSPKREGRCSSSSREGGSGYQGDTREVYRRFK